MADPNISALPPEPQRAVSPRPTTTRAQRRAAPHQPRRLAQTRDQAFLSPSAQAQATRQAAETQVSDPQPRAAAPTRAPGRLQQILAMLPGVPIGRITAEELLRRRQVLRDIDEGRLKPDPNSRLGAYLATRGFPPGTVGHSVHNAIGTIFLGLGNLGEEQIGTVFNSDAARALYHQPVDGPASRQIAEMEYAYWAQVRRQNPWSIGGRLGTMFGPDSRDVLQRWIFSQLP